MPLDCMIEFRLKGGMNRAPKTGFFAGETCLLRLSQILCLFPDHHQIRTTESGWTIDVYEEDWPKVERAFRNNYLGGKVKAM